MLESKVGFGRNDNRSQCGGGICDRSRIIIGIQGVSAGSGKGSIGRVQLPAGIGAVVERPIGGAAFKVVGEENVGVCPGGGAERRVGVEARGGLCVHFHRIQRILHLRNQSPAVMPFHPDQIGTSLLQDKVQIRVICAGREQVGLGFVIDRAGLLPAEACYCFPIEESAIHHQEGRLVVDAAVGVHAAVTLPTGEIIRAGDPVRVAVGGRVAHAAQTNGRQRRWI